MEQRINKLVLDLHKKQIAGTVDNNDTLAEVNYAEENGQTALHFVTDCELTEVAELLLEYGADASILDKKGLAPIHIAVKKNNSRIVKHMLKIQPEAVNVTSTSDNINQGFSPLHFACEIPDSEVLPLLLSTEKVNINQCEMTGRTPCHWAAIKGSIKALYSLLKAGADIDSCDNDNRTPLVLASQVGRVEVVSFLLQNAPVRVNLRDSLGDTVLHHTAEIQMQRYLFNYNWHMNKQHIEVFFFFSSQNRTQTLFCVTRTVIHHWILLCVPWLTFLKLFIKIRHYSGLYSLSRCL